MRSDAENCAGCSRSILIGTSASRAKSNRPIHGLGFSCQLLWALAVALALALALALGGRIITVLNSGPLRLLHESLHCATCTWH